MNYFRAQHGHYTFEQMQAYVSQDGGDDCESAGGLCACMSVNDLLNNTVMDALDGDDQVIVIRGYKVCDIYDGCRIEPVAEVARFSVKYFIENAEQIAAQYETW